MNKFILLIATVLFTSATYSQTNFKWRAEVFSKPHLLTYDQKTGANKADGTSYVVQDVVLGMHYKFPSILSETNIELFNLNIVTDTDDSSLFLTSIDQSFSYKNFFASVQYDQLPLINFGNNETTVQKMNVVWTNVGYRILLSKKWKLKSKIFLGYPVNVNAEQSVSSVSGLRAYGDITWRKRVKRRWDFYTNLFVDSKNVDFKSEGEKTDLSIFRTGVGIGLSYLL